VQKSTQELHGLLNDASLLRVVVDQNDAQPRALCVVVDVEVMSGKTLTCHGELVRVVVRVE
jgi:hypothetical protein